MRAVPLRNFRKKDGIQTNLTVETPMALLRHRGLPFPVLLSGAGSLYSHGSMDRFSTLPLSHLRCSVLRVRSGSVLLHLLLRLHRTYSLLLESMDRCEPSVAHNNSQRRCTGSQ